MNPFSTKPPPATAEPLSGGAAIRDALSKVQRLRDDWQSDAQRLAQVQWVKAFQTRRFAGQYHDFLNNPRFSGAAGFFLHRLYGQEQPQQRDAQFARIANAIGAVFPAQVVDTAIQVSQLHALTETLDDAMGQARAGLNASDEVLAYVMGWQAVGQREARQAQLRQVLQLGHNMAALAKVRGLGLSLRMMRGPAQLAQLGDLQNWLEEGFRTFCELDRQKGATEEFLTEIEQRESTLIDALYTPDVHVGCHALRAVLYPATQA